MTKDADNYGCDRHPLVMATRLFYQMRDYQICDEQNELLKVDGQISMTTHNRNGKHYANITRALHRTDIVARITQA